MLLGWLPLRWLLLGWLVLKWLLLGWLLLGWLLLRWLLLRWLLFGWLLLGWLLLRWLLLRWLLLIINLNKTPLGETRCLSNIYFLLTGCLGIQFFNLPPFPTQSVRLPLVTYPSLCSTCVTYRTPCHVISHQVLPTQPLIYPPFPTQSVSLPLVTYLPLCSTCAACRAPCRAIGHRVLPTRPLPKGAEDFPRGGNHFGHMPLLTYLA